MGPVESERDGCEVVSWVVLRALGVVDESGEDDDAQYEEEHQQHELVRARLERLYENLESGRVARQLEQSHDPNYAENTSHAHAQITAESC